MRKVWIKIAAAVCLVALAGTGLFFWKKAFFPTSEGAGQIVVTIEDAAGTAETETISFEEGDTLFDVLEREYTVTYTKSELYGATLLSVGNIHTDFSSSYIAVFVDGQYSPVGCSFIALADGMSVRLVETPL